MMRSLIVGYGTVGSNLKKELNRINFDVTDKYKHIECEGGHYDVAFICVDTPLVDGYVDCSEVENAINENDADVYVIKSTVFVGFADYLKEKNG